MIFDSHRETHIDLRKSDDDVLRGGRCNDELFEVPAQR